MSDFKREERYVVLKLKHMTSSERIALQDIVLNNMGFAVHQKPCVVVESDWPIYEQTWGAIQRLAENKPQKIKKLEQQLAEYKARIEDLDDLVHMMLPFVETAKGDVHYRQDKINKALNKFKDIVSRTNNQSLALHDADVIEAAKQEMLREMDTWESFSVAQAIRWFDVYIQRLRSE